MPREVLESTTTPDGELVELALEGEAYVIRVGGLPLMSSADHGSEQAMAQAAHRRLGRRSNCRVLVGGLGLGFSLRAALDTFGPDARLTVAELLSPLIAYHEGVLGPLADHPLRDPRVRVFRGDVQKPLQTQRWDAVLMDVDNGPFAFTAERNRMLYEPEGVARMAGALTPGGVLVVWSAYESQAFTAVLQDAGLRVSVEPVASPDVRHQGDGPEHLLFVAQRPG